MLTVLRLFLIDDDETERMICVHSMFVMLLLAVGWYVEFDVY